MRIAVVSDIHGNLPALEAVARDIARRAADVVVNLGDSLSGPLLPRETAAFLMAQDWVHLAGNHERQLLTLGPGRWGPSDEYAHAQLTSAELAWIATLVPCRQLNDEVLLCHGTPRSDLEYFLETVTPGGVRAATRDEVALRLGEVSAGLVLCGHTHVARVLRAGGGTLIVNPGSVGLPAYTDEHPHPHAIETGSPDARYALVERRAGAWGCELISVPYDWRSMSALARARGRSDWANALASGYVS